MHSFTFINDPEPRSIAQYHDAVATVLDLLRKGPDVKAVYLAGGKWIPGISDIDLMVVFPDDAIPPAPLFSPRRLSKEAAYCFTHNMGTYDETSFAHLFFIIPDLTRLECIAGTPVSVEDPRTTLSENAYTVLQAAILFDLIANKLWKFFLYQDQTVFDTRKILGEFYSLTYTLRLLDRLGVSLNGQTYIQDFTHLRESWFLRSVEENHHILSQLIPQGIDLTARIIETVARFTESVFLGRDTGKREPVTFFGGRTLFEFVPEWSRGKMEKALREDTISVMRLNQHHILLPSVLSSYLAAYAEEENLFGTIIRRNLRPFPKRTPVNVPEGIKEHARFLSHLWYTSYQNNGSLKVPFYFGCEPKPATVRRRLRNFLFRALRFSRGLV